VLGWQELVGSLNLAAGDDLKVILEGNSQDNLTADAVRLDRKVTRTYVYDGNGNVRTDTDTRGKTTEFTYDELNRLDQTHSPDTDGNAATFDALVTDRVYDGYGNVVSEHHGHQSSTTGYVVRRTDTFKYDKRNRLIEEVIDAGADRFNVTTAYEYDNTGNLTLVTDAEGFETHYRYDNLNRLVDEYQDFGENRPNDPIGLSQGSVSSYTTGDGQGVPSSAVVSGDLKSISLTGNAWKAISLSYFVQHNTVLEFDFQSDAPGLLHMIGFDTNSMHASADYPHFFQLAGPDTFEQYKTEFRSQTHQDGTVTFHIPIGQYLTDAEKVSGFLMDRLVLVNWEDRSDLAPIDQGKSVFSNFRLYESDEVRTVTTYDAAGNVEKVREASDPRNITTRYEYDGVGRQTRAILDDGGPMQRSYTTIYDATGNVLIERNDTAGIETVHEYDALNRLVKTTQPDPDGNASTFNGLVHKFEYDPAGNVIREVNGIDEVYPGFFLEVETTHTDYDSRGRVITDTDGNGDQTHYRYDSEGNLLAVTDAEENVTSYAYDALGRPKTDTNAFGTRTTEYDLHGNVESITDRNGRIRTFVYDTLDRRIREDWTTTTDPTITHRLSWTYDKLDRVTKEVDSNNEVLGDSDDIVDTFQYDGLGRLILQTNYDPASTLGASGRPEIDQSYEYSKSGLGLEGNIVLRSQNVRGNSNAIATTRSARDHLGQLKSTLDTNLSNGIVLGGWSLNFGYDVSGNLTGVVGTSAGSFPPQHPYRVSSFAYDRANRLSSIVHTIDDQYGIWSTMIATHSYIYDNASRIKTFNTTGSSDANRGYTYDDAGQLKTKTGDAAESYTYDENGNRVTVGTQSIVTVDGNRLLDDGLYTYVYDAEGNLTRRIEKSNGNATDYTWDHRNRLVKVEYVGAPQTPAFNFTGINPSSYTGQDDPANGQATIEDSGATVHLTGKAWKRVTFSSLGLSPTITITPNTVLSFDFNSPNEGNMIAIGLDNTDNAINNPKRHFQLAGAVTSGTFAGISPGVSYQGGWQHYEIRLADFAGYAEFVHTTGYWNRLTFINNAGGGESFFKNIRLYEPTVLESTSYTYDAQGRRVVRTHDLNGAAAGGISSQYFVYDGDDLAMTFGDAGQLTHRYLYGPQLDQVLVDEVFSADPGHLSDAVLWLLGDHQGTIRHIVDDEGVLRKHIDYDSFGNIVDEVYSGGGGPGFPGPIVDQLFYFAGQERDEATGLQQHGERWYDTFTARFLSEDRIKADWNLYRYALNNPVIYVDPTGLYTQTPLDYLPGLSGSVFAPSTPSRAARNLGYSDFGSLSRNLTPLSWSAIGNALGSVAYDTAKDRVAPIATAAIRASVALPLANQFGFPQTNTGDKGPSQPLATSDQQPSSDGIIANAWNNVAKPFWQGVASAPGQILKMTTPGQLYSLWQGDHPINGWLNEVQDDGLVAGSIDHAGNYYGGLIEQTSPYQATVGNYVRYHGVFPRNESDVIRSQELQARTGETVGGAVISLGLAELVPLVRSSSSRSTSPVSPAMESDTILLSAESIDPFYRSKIVGKAQETQTPGHRFRAYREALKAAKNPNVEAVYLNRGYNGALKLEPNTISPNVRPDVTIVFKDGRVGRVEVQSFSDTFEDLMYRNEQLDFQIREQGYIPRQPIVVVPTASR
jgi:RHS repeat-associated protein